MFAKCLPNVSQMLAENLLKCNFYDKNKLHKNFDEYVDDFSFDLKNNNELKNHIINSIKKDAFIFTKNNNDIEI